MSPDAANPVRARIEPNLRDIGGFSVSRLLPSRQQRMIGPFAFFDQMGPAQIAAGEGIDVRPHPHIGLATLTYLYEGEIEHRDSLGSHQLIRPDEVNWMVAGRGITHSERTREAVRQQSHPLSGIQTWVALPDEHEETEPLFEHFGSADLPLVQGDGTRARVIVGSAFGAQAPATTYSGIFFVDASIDAGCSLVLDTEHRDRGAFIAQGSLSIAGETYSPGELIVFEPDVPVELSAPTSNTRIALLGGEPFDAPRHLWWNFVASSKDKIESAKQSWREADWENGRFQLPPDDRDEFIPLPD